MIDEPIDDGERDTGLQVAVSGGVEAEARMPEAELTDDMIAAMREKVGVQLRIDHSTNNEVVTRLSVARFAGGIGDTNSLWLDAEHAEQSVYGAPVAPPSWVICCFSGIQFGWPGLGSFHASSDLTFHQPIYVDDVLTPSCLYQGFDGPRSSTFAGRSVTDHFLNRYHNQRGELVAEIHWTVINVERAAAKSNSKAVGTRPLDLPHRWSESELEVIEDQIAQESPRSSVPRYWEDVAVGDSLEEILKGPIGTTDEVAFVASGGAPIPRLQAHRASLLEYRKHPAWAFRDPTTSALEPIYSVHYNRNAAQAMGVAMQYDVGFQRQCWQVQLLTDWMGDDGWLKSCSAQYRSFVYLSDVVRLHGTVTAKRLDEDGDSVVDIETHATNQRGQDAMPGRAVIALPTRTGVNPVTRRARRRHDSE